MNAAKRLLKADEVPTQQLPFTARTRAARKPPKKRVLLVDNNSKPQSPVAVVGSKYHEAVTQTDICGVPCECKAELAKVTEELTQLKHQIERQKFRLANISHHDSKICFYTGFPSYLSLKACYDFLGPATNSLSYSSRTEGECTTGRRCRPRTLPPEEEFFLVLVRLRLGLMEQDLADRFEISQSTVSRITNTWINFLYLKLKEIPLWPPKELVKANMPKQFRIMYPSTRVIIDATEIFINQPSLPEIQQMTFSNYKHHNTFKGLIGISPSGAVTFVSKLYPGSISDKQLTRRSGLLDILERGDSVMADRGFDIEDDLVVRGVQLNIPPFLRGKKQLDEGEVIVTRRIASLRIHVERQMERLKNFHIFDRTIPATLTNIADRIFFVCCILTNFYPPLC